MYETDLNSLSLLGKTLILLVALAVCVGLIVGAWSWLAP